MPFIKKTARITVNKTVIAVQTLEAEGGWEGPFLVFLHHALGSIAQWKDFPKDLAERTGLPAVLIDRQGHGESDEMKADRGPGYLHVEALEFLPAALSELGIRRPVLVGHSDGASIALLYAAHFPAAGVIAEAPHILVEDHTLEGIRKAMEGKDELCRRLEKYHGAKAGRLVDAWAGTWLAPWFRDWNISAELRGISCPLLVIQGASDPYGTNVHLEGILKALPRNACPLLVKGGGHFLHAEARELLLERMAGFIRNTISHHTIPEI